MNNGIPLTLRFRSVKLFRISVKGDGSVEAVAPRALSRAAAMALANGRAEWVRSHREEILSRASRASQYVSGETAPLWGREYALRVETGTPGAVLRDDELVLSAPEGADVQSRRAALLSLYRSELERAIPPLVEKYAAALSVPAPQWSLRPGEGHGALCAEPGGQAAAVPRIRRGARAGASAHPRARRGLPRACTQRFPKRARGHGAAACTKLTK